MLLKVTDFPSIVVVQLRTEVLEGNVTYEGNSIVTIPFMGMIFVGVMENV